MLQLHTSTAQKLTHKIYIYFDYLSNQPFLSELALITVQVRLPEPDKFMLGTYFLKSCAYWNSLDLFQNSAGP